MTDPDRRRAARHACLMLLAALVAGGVLRLSTAWHRSLWIDEFHALFHAGQPSLAALLEGLERDNHPPASFALLQAWSGIVGQGQVAVRIPSILYGLGTIWLAWRLAGRMAGPAAAVGAAWVVALSSLGVLIGAEARMYGLLALALAGTLEALAAWKEGRPLPWRAGLWIGLGCLTHYWFLHHLAWIGSIMVGRVLAWRGASWSARARALAPIGLGALIALPWYASGFVRQLLGHELAPGSGSVTLIRVVWSYMQLLFFNLGTLERPLAWALAGAGMALLALGGFGALRALHSTTGIAVAGSALLLAPFGALMATLFPRAGFGWSYLAGAIPALGALIGVGYACLPRKAALWVGPTLVGALALGASTQALSAGTEDLRGAARHVIEECREGDAVLPVEWQPPLFPNGSAWRYYGTPDLPVLESGQDCGLKEFPDPPPRRVFVYQRGLPPDALLHRQLERRYETVESKRFGYSVFVITYSGPR